MMNRPGLAAAAIASQLQHALALLQRGRTAEACAVCQEVLARTPDNAEALHLLAIVYLQRGNYAEAEHWLKAAVAANPANAAAWSNYAVAMIGLGRPGDALDQCERALRLNHGFAEAHLNRGHSLAALARTHESLASYDEALRLAPGRTEIHNARGRVLLKLKRADESFAAFERALSASPNDPEILNSRGCALRMLRRSSEALQDFQRALQIKPDYAAALCNIANVHLDAGNYEEALRHCDAASSLRPELADAWHIRGTALRALNRYELAADSFERLADLAPAFDLGAGDLYFARARICDWAKRAGQSSAIVQAVGAGERAISPHAFLSLSDSPAAQLQCARTFVASLPAGLPFWRGESYAHRRIRVAYLSSDFHEHAVARLVVGVLERHDRSRFETFGISLTAERQADAMHERMRGAFEHFHDVGVLSDRDVALQMRAAEIDMAVDLNGHTHGSRLGIFALRPAPLQLGFLGFTGTSGSPHIDWLIADRFAVPSGLEPYFTEKIAHLPHSFLPTDDRQAIDTKGPGRRELGLPESGFVFCAFNLSYKLNPAMFDLWMTLLRETPGSVLWLQDGEAALRANLRREAIARGVTAERLVFAPRVPQMGLHLARYRHADLFLDTFPYGGHATARDALWAGLPVLTCVGRSFASRVAGSLLTVLGLPELITSSLDDYAARARLLVSTPDYLAQIRCKLERHGKSTPTFNTEKFTLDLESLYESLRFRPQDSIR